MVINRDDNRSTCAKLDAQGLMDATWFHVLSNIAEVTAGKIETDKR